MAIYEEIKNNGAESGIRSDAVWLDKNGKSFWYDEKGKLRLVRFHAETNVIDIGKPVTMIAVETGYPAKDLEYGRPFGYNPYEKGPTAAICVPDEYLGEDKGNAKRFELLDKIEDAYKKDLVSGQHGLSKFVKEFATGKDNALPPAIFRGEAAVRFQAELQKFVDKIVQKELDAQKGMTAQKENAFNKLSGKEKNFVVRAQNWARKNNIRTKDGYAVSFNSKAADHSKEFDRFAGEVVRLGFVDKQPAKKPLVNTNAGMQQDAGRA